jgi:DNA uptake protein ComE-like DNA-binding protein
MPLSPRLQRLTWTSGQRLALTAIILLLLAVLMTRYVMNRSYVSDPQLSDPARAHELADRIDPNTADWEVLAALPQIGEKRAKSIVDHRERSRRLRPDEAVFQKPEDLLRIRGFGAATIEHLRPFLIFPTTKPATTRAHAE